MKHWQAPTAAGFVGIVLAGGHSARMGRDKAMLPYRGRTLLEHMAALLQASGACRVLVSGPPRTGYTSVPDRQPELGPLGGIHAVVTTLAGTPDSIRLLIVPVDMPALSIPTLTTLLQLSPGIRACHYAEHPLPLGLALDETVRAQLNRLMEDTVRPAAERSLHAFCSGLHARVLPMAREIEQEFAGLNTPEEWAAFRAACDAVPAP